MNISKIMKKKRDAEVRLQKTSPTPSYSSDGTNESYIDLYKLATKNDLAAKSDKSHEHEIVDLTDVAITYTANAGKFLKVNVTEDGVDLGEASGGASTFIGLTDTPAAYTGQSGKVPTVKATEDGFEFENAPAAANGLPTGGAAGQILSKVDETNYNAQWVDAPSGGGGIEIQVLIGADGLTSGRTESGYGCRVKTFGDYDIAGGFFNTTWDNGVTYTCKLWDTSNTVVASGTITGDGTTGYKDVYFTTPYTITKYTDYHLSIEKPSGNIVKYYSSTAVPLPFMKVVSSYSGLPTAQNSAGVPYSMGAIIQF